jgi:DNA-binding protein Fis
MKYTQEKMKEANMRQASGESRQQVSKSLGTNERTLRKRLKALKYL